jgi:hypothetical protein
LNRVLNRFTERLRSCCNNLKALIVAHSTCPVVIHRLSYIFLSAAQPSKRRSLCKYAYVRMEITRRIAITNKYGLALDSVDRLGSIATGTDHPISTTEQTQYWHQKGLNHAKSQQANL